jgi:hypothetical protein
VDQASQRDLRILTEIAERQEMGVEPIAVYVW